MRLFEIPHLVEASAIDIYSTDDSSAQNLLCFHFRHEATTFFNFIPQSEQCQCIKEQQNVVKAITDYGLELLSF